MKAEFVNPIYQATNDVLKNMLDIEDIERGEMSMNEEMVQGSDANVTIGVTGNLSGSILYSFSKEMALEMVEIMSGMKMEELDKFVSSAVGEIANIISGNAVTYLANNGYECDIVPPQVSIGRSKSLSMANKKVLEVPLSTEVGDFTINISVEEK